MVKYFVWLTFVVAFGCSEQAPLPAEQSSDGHGKVLLLGVYCKSSEEGSVNWGDGTTSDLFRQRNSHTYVHNGSYTVTVQCGNWPFGSRYITHANVNTAVEQAAFFGLSGAALSGIAALITAIVGVLTFLLGKGQKKD